MADTEHEALDDLEVEITDLDPTLNRKYRHSLRLTSRQRRWSAAVTCVLFVLVVGLFLASMSDVRGLLARTLFRPAPPVPANELAVYLEGNPSWGHFSIDGSPIAHLPVVGHDTPLALPFGLHTITWQVAPFRPQRCVFTVMDASTIDGPCLHNGEVSVDSVVNKQAMVLTFLASANGLPATQHATLIQQLQKAVAIYGSSELVHTGEAYAISEQQIEANPALCTLVTRLALAVCTARASQPLQATLSVQVDSSASPADPCARSEQCFISGQDCRALCSNPYNNNLEEGWSVLAVISLSWSYTTLSGQVIARAQPDSALRGTDGYQIVPVHIIRTSQGWQLSLSPTGSGAGSADPRCYQAAQDTSELVSASSGNQEMYVQQVADMQARGAAGCLVVLKTSPGTALNPTTPIAGSGSPQVVYCLVRFGVVLTVNHLAQQNWPFLPLVDDYENGLAQTLLATLPPLT